MDFGPKKFSVKISRAHINRDSIDQNTSKHCSGFPIGPARGRVEPKCDFIGWIIFFLLESR